MKTLEYSRKLIAAGTLTPVIDNRYTIQNTVEIHSYVEKGYKRSNVVITDTRIDEGSYE